MSDRADPWAGTTYNGFAGLAELPPPAPSRLSRPRASRKLLFGGVAAAATLGLVLGFAARPNLVQPASKPAPMQPVARASTETLDIEINKPVILPAPKPTGRLEVLPPDLARSAPRRVAASAQVEARPDADPASDCRALGSAAEQLVCEDPALSRADWRLQQAYDRALRSGAMPARDLRDEQQDWMAIREDAARRSPFAVRRLYEQRIEELNALVEEAPG
jgi:uncharacterized protein YecT (DUF1311 family)